MENIELFPQKKEETKPPLAEKIRPKTINEFIGLEEIMGKEAFLYSAIKNDSIPSLILWGPAGSGKTTIANIVKNSTKNFFVPFSAVLGGVKDVREIIDRAKIRLQQSGRKTILFVDEIHRFNKAQQDAFLPHVEKGVIILIGATTENPSFYLISPLISRCKVIKLRPLTVQEIKKIIKRAIEIRDKWAEGFEVNLNEKVIEKISHFSDGDARRALNLLEDIVNFAKKEKCEITTEICEKILSDITLRYDRAYEEHYNVISAFIKSLRSSDPDAALYYAMRMIEAGEDPLFVLRRMVIFASEDIGNADPMSLVVATSALTAFERIGMPEGIIPISQAVTYLATAPKSNASYVAMNLAKEDVKNYGSIEIPLHLRNAPTKLMEEFGYGKGYKSPHNFPDAFLKTNYLPEELKGKIYYVPKDKGYEKEIKKRLDEWREKRKI